MWNRHEFRAAAAFVWAVAIATGAGFGIAGAASPAGESPARLETAAPATTPEVGDTRENLNKAFANEANNKARYLESAKVAEREQYPYVAQLFRACAAAEQVHADRHVTAIAWTGGEAKAFLQKLAMGTTAENLRMAIGIEDYEANQLYPAMLARARDDGRVHAVRSINYAMAAEREHARLLAAALETLDQRLPQRAIHVCPQCGKTVEEISFRKCPNCFSSAGKFQRVD